MHDLKTMARRHGAEDETQSDSSLVEEKWLASTRQPEWDALWRVLLLAVAMKLDEPRSAQGAPKGFEPLCPSNYSSSKGGCMIQRG